MGGDGLHPTEQGLQLMATTFLTAIEAAFPVGIVSVAGSPLVLVEALQRPPSGPRSGGH